MERTHISETKWTELWRESKAEGQPLVSNGSLRPLLDAKNARNRRYSLLRELSRLVWRGTLPTHSVRYCSRRAIPAQTKKKDGTWVPTGKSGNIEIHSREVDGAKKHNYHGLGRCASPLVCPFCSAVIQSFRAQETMLMGQYMLQNGFQVALITQTASHTRATSLIDFVARFQAAQHDMKAWREYKKWQKETGAKFTIRAIETTDDNPDVGGRKSGWHFHSHTIVFFERDKAFTRREAEKFTKQFKKMWVAALAGVGLEGSIEHAARVDLPRANEKLDAARETQSAEDVEKLCAYISKAFGWEVAGSRNKKGRSEKDRRISVWELQEAALTDRPDLLPRYAEYMRAVKGLNWLRPSQGLKAFCGLPEIKDKEVLESGEKGEFVYWFSNENFKHIWRQAGQGKLLDIADREGRDGIEKAMFAAMNNCDIETGEELKE
jgi:hypothetical protein